MTENENFLTIKEFAHKVNYSKRQIRQFCKDEKIKAQKLTTGSRKWLISKSELNKFGGEVKPATQISSISQVNWVEDYEAEHRELPLIPDFMAPLVKDYTPRAKVSKGMELKYSPPYWDNLKPSQQKQMLQLVEWMGQDKDDYIDMINRHRPGRPSDIQVHWKR